MARATGTKKKTPAKTPRSKTEPKKRGRGRPPKMDRERTKRIAERVSGFMTYEDAAIVEGISYRTHCRYMAVGAQRIIDRERELQAKGTEPEKIDAALARLTKADDYCHYWHTLREAKALSQSFGVNVATSIAADTNEKAADRLRAVSFLLERRFPETFGQSSRVDLTTHEPLDDLIDVLDSPERSQAAVDFVAVMTAPK